MWLHVSKCCGHCISFAQKAKCAEKLLRCDILEEHEKVPYVNNVIFL